MTAATILLMPVAGRTYVVTSGANYTADQNGIVASSTISTSDVTDLKNAGGALLVPPPTNLIGNLKGANFNSTADQPINSLINIKARVTKIVVTNTSVPGMSTAAGGIYTGPGKTGTQIVAAAQVYTGLTNALTALELTLNAPTLVLPALQNLYFALTTAQGAPATGDIFLLGETYA
jgi:hypothetical protein